MNHQIVVYILIAYAISFVPFVGRYVSMINTLVHENGHAIVALLFSGKVYSIKLFQNTEGLAVTGQRGWLATVAISYAGYTFSSIVAYLCFYFLKQGQENLILYALISIAILNLILWIRNVYGAVWLISFIVCCGWTIQSGSDSVQTFLSYFLSAVLLTQSVSSALQIFLLSLFRSKRAGDATSLAHYTKVPAIVWGFLFFAQSVYIAYLAIANHFN
ncbi:M50 family metallopeptidase [Metabacillus rhizolycopersici]|uniref:M50 family metallopeptidase n=1 Tax=Metabacillus rhizolycopersici TaxID=2875709 RepID=A0ABS7UXD5_9BACI|nr:M50 family metallopeptidase [Metabacillus rhizolycopersici]MBZ5752712.1 M50 family metallopeptidase [Metabacillus rhizolycopersici]